MKVLALLVPMLAVNMALAGAMPATAESPPPWAYPLAPADQHAPVDDGSLRHVPDSAQAFTLSQVRDRFLSPDWHPDDHPPLPEVVAHGRPPDVSACGYCHRADGPGGPENSGVAGLPAAYIVEQMADFANGSRGTSLPERGPPKSMIAVAKAANAAEVQAAAQYFSALRPRANLRVVEARAVPKTLVLGGHLAKLPGDGKEPIGNRIIEVPEDLEQFVSRDTHSRFLAYVPPGSIRQGHLLAAGGGKTQACASCHGAELRGVGNVPPLAGRSPSYIVRQLYDFKHGARAGAGGAPMQPVVQQLTVDDMLALAAYTASLPP